MLKGYAAEFGPLQGVHIYAEVKQHVRVAYSHFMSMMLKVHCLHQIPQTSVRNGQLLCLAYSGASLAGRAMSTAAALVLAASFAACTAA